jgi:competence CoiA-like predicted nuclease
MTMCRESGQRVSGVMCNAARAAKTRVVVCPACGREVKTRLGLSHAGYWQYPRHKSASDAGCQKHGDGRHAPRVSGALC